MKFEDFLKHGFDRPLPEPPASEIRERVAKDAGRADPGDLDLARRTAWPIRFFRSHPRLMACSSVAALLLLGFVGLLILAQEALPGDPLYALKRTYESARLALAPASFDLRTELARERTDELQRLDKDSQLDVGRARMLIREINDHLVCAYGISADERLERCSEEMFDRVIRIIDGHDFVVVDHEFPMPVFFRRHIGIQRAYVSVMMREVKPSLWGEGNHVYVMIDGKIFKVDSKTMKLVKEQR